MPRIALALLIATLIPLATSGVAQQAPPLAQAQVETVLRAHGYDRIAGLERTPAGSYRLATAERFGAPVGPLEVDAATGRVLDEAPLSETQLVRLLQARDYAEVLEIRPAGAALFVRARRQGTEMALRVDPRDGVVRPWLAD